MNINLNSFSNGVNLFFKESVLPSVTAQQKKILMIASIAFGFLVACYLANRYFFKAASPQIEEDP